MLAVFHLKLGHLSGLLCHFFLPADEPQLSCVLVRTSPKSLLPAGSGGPTARQGCWLNPLSHMRRRAENKRARVLALGTPGARGRNCHTMWNFEILTAIFTHLHLEDDEIIRDWFFPIRSPLNNISIFSFAINHWELWQMHRRSSALNTTYSFFFWYPWVLSFLSTCNLSSSLAY